MHHCPQVPVQCLPETTKHSMSRQHLCGMGHATRAPKELPTMLTQHPCENAPGSTGSIEQGMHTAELHAYTQARRSTEKGFSGVKGLCQHQATMAMQQSATCNLCPHVLHPCHIITQHMTVKIALLQLQRAVQGWPGRSGHL